MDLNSQRERLSLVYIEAVASCAGYQVTEPKVDRDSIDGKLIADFGRRPEINFQAKATSQDIIQGNNIHYPLSIKNYNDLRIDVVNPRILIVFLMPKETQDWINQTDNEICLRHCAYWMCLKGEPRKPNTATITVNVPLTNIFDVDQLTDMMQRTERGDEIC